MTLAHLKCRCGELINIGEIPCDVGMYIYSEDRVGDIENEIKKAFNEGNTSVFEFLFTVTRSKKGNVQGYECPNCGRWLIQRTGSDADVLLWLKPEAVDGEATPRIAPILAESGKK